MSEPTRRITSNPARKPESTDNPLADANAYERWRREREEWRATARPVVVVDLDLPFSAVVALYVQFAVIQLGVALVVVVVLYFLGVF